MTLISRLFKKAPPAHNTTVSKKERVVSLEQNIEQLDQLADDDIVNIAVGDREQGLRIAAIAKLPYGEALKNLAFNHNASKVQISARERIATLMDNDGLRFEQLDKEISDKVALLAVASFSKQAQLQEQILDNADDKDLLYKVALNGVSAKLRKAAAHRITDRDSLEQLLKQSRGKDKTIYRIVKEKCDFFKEQDQHKQQLKTDIEALCTAIERLSKRAFDPMFNANFNHLKEQWGILKAKEIPEISAQLHQRINSALAACEAIVEEQARVQAEHEQKMQAVANAASERDNILHELHQLLISQYTIDELSADFDQQITHVLSQQHIKWDESIQHAAAEQQQLRLYKQLSDGIVFLQHQLTEYGTLKHQFQQLLESQESVDASDIQALRKWMNNVYLLEQTPLPERVIEVQQWIAQWDQKRQQEKSDAQQAIRQIGGLIRRAGDAIERGQVRQAAGIHRSIEQKLADVKKVPAGLSDQLEQLNQKLGRLQDWRSYAVQPKIEELVEQMQALVGAALNPDLLAEKIKSLQDQWKLLSKGGGSQYQDQWDNFHQLAQTAYEPCKMYFQKQAKTRQENLQKRKNLVTQLQDFFDNYDWDNADWKMVEKMLRVARQEWRDYNPTDRSATKKVQRAFNDQLDSVQHRLNEEYKRNIKRKQQLIDQAKSLIDSEDSRASVEDVKKLQAQWKSIGVVSRKADQALWQEFRAHCDGVFEKRQQKSVEFKVQLNASKDQALVLCDEIQALSSLEGQELFEARKELDRLRSAFHELGNMPKNSINAVNAKFSAAIEKFETKIVSERKKAKEVIWRNLFDANEALIQYELSQLSDDNTQETEQTVQEVLETITDWPKGGREAIEKKLARVKQKEQLEFDINEAAFRELCIRMEILADTQTPESDQAMRMEFQVKRLQKGLGQNVLSSELVMNDLIFEWISVHCVPIDIYRTLLERFNHSRELLA